MDEKDLISSRQVASYTFNNHIFPDRMFHLFVGIHLRVDQKRPQKRPHDAISLLFKGWIGLRHQGTRDHVSF